MLGILQVNETYKKMLNTVPRYILTLQVKFKTQWKFKQKKRDGAHLREETPTQIENFYLKKTSETAAINIRLISKLVLRLQTNLKSHRKLFELLSDMP